ncbi:MAG: GIY-YIG nuclease family protein [Deferribacteres bacterium]|nr:GIY-YIG nuclease family protein [candidate division KSB1 bacterium]MCB9504445.1 GIY-YIG nuclease family protein [Deferribacteres bacterium]
MYYVYMLTNQNNTVLYTGMTNDILTRIHEHKLGNHKGFSKKYNCTKLVWFSRFSTAIDAIAFEKKLKKWKREYKENLIDELNADWKDLAENILLNVR